MNARPQVVLKRQTIPAGTTKYVPIPSYYHGLVGIHVSWFDAVSSATIELQSTNYKAADAKDDVDETQAGNEHKWAPESDVSITGPSASGAGCSMTHISSNGARRGRLKIVTAAETDMEIVFHGKS